MAPRYESVSVDLPGGQHNPLRHIGVRLATALGLIAFVALLTYFGRDGYEDPSGGSVTLLDAFYYSTVTITTTGYGDILPVTDSARFVTTVLVTPARVLFLIILVGTTLEILAERSREAYRRNRWRKTLKDHVIVCGFGTKGQSAVSTLRDKGCKETEIVVIDERADARSKATARGYSAVGGSVTSTDSLAEAGIENARAIVVAVDRDDTAVLATLTARELNPSASIVAAVREEENVHLLQQSGATSVVTTASAAGRLLGHAVDEPRVTEVLEDLLSVGDGLDIAEHEVTEDEAGPTRACLKPNGIAVGVIRGDELMRFDDPRATHVEAGDRVVYLHSNRADEASE